MEVDSLGRKIRDKTIGGNSIEEHSTRHGVRKVGDWGYLLAGSSLSTNGYDKTDSCRGDYDFWLILLDTTLQNIKWQGTIGGSDTDFCMGTTVLSDGSIIATGYSVSGISGDKKTPGKGGEDYWVVKLKPDQPLALERFTLTVQKAFDRVRLNWQSTGKATDHYFIQRTDTLSRPFTVIGERQGTTSFSDTHPLTGYNYYRIQAISESNDTSYSNIASVRHYVAPEAGLQIATVGDQVEINYRFAGQLPAEMAVFDLNGQAVWQATVWHNDGQFTFPKRDLSAGVYSCRLSANLVFFHQQKFIITK